MASNTKLEILRYATELFLEKGYTTAYITAIANKLDISTGNLTFHFPTKEHLLAGLVIELCEFQYEGGENTENNDEDALFGYLFELAMFASLCAENPNISDLIVSAYTHSMSIEIIRKNDTLRAMRAFGKYCPQWTKADFIMAENIAFGIEYSMFLTENAEIISFKERVSSCIDAIMKVYDVPKEIRENIINDIFSADYRGKGSKIFEEFCEYLKDSFQK